MLYLVKSGLKAEHRNSFLGYFWWLLDPLLNAIVYYFLVVVILKRGGENYGLFLVVGLVAWRWTSSVLGSSAKAITSHASIINQVYLPKAIFPITRTLSQTANFLFGLIVIGIFLAFYGIVPGWQVIYLPLIMMTQLLMMLVISLMIAFVSIFVRDIENIIGHLTRVWFYASPVIWEGGRLPDSYRWIVDINPIAYLLDSYRNVLIYRSTPNVMGLTLIATVSLVFISCLLFYYSRYEHKIIKSL